jgi:hypothetical protein
MKQKAVVPAVKTAPVSKVTPLARTNAGVKPGASKVQPIKETPKPQTTEELWPKSEDPKSVMDVKQIGDPEVRIALFQMINEAFRLKKLVADAKLTLEGIKEDPKKGQKKVMGLMEEITLVQKELGIKTLFVDVPEGTIENTFYRGTNVQLNVGKLLENGVPAEVIEKSKTSKSYVTCVTKLKGAKDE